MLLYTDFTVFSVLNLNLKQTIIAFKLMVE